jgi:putative transposase
MTAWLKTQGEVVNHKRVARLMRQMGLEAIYPRPKTSHPADNVLLSLSAQGLGD